jgi:hypothetical protein
MDRGLVLYGVSFCGRFFLRLARFRGWSGKLLFVLNFGAAVSLVEEPSLLAGCVLMLLLPSFLLQTWTFDSKQSDTVLSLFSAVPDAFCAGAEEASAITTQCYLRLRRARVAEALKNALVPLLFTALFAVLFREANPIIERYLNAIRIDLHLDVLRIAFWSFVLPLIFIALKLHAPAAQPERPPESSVGGGQTSSIGLEHILPPPIVVRSLILFNALFLVNNLFSKGRV